MKYNFDELINRENTACYKYDFRKDYFGTEYVLPMWVADMDFKTPLFIIEAIKNRLKHEILGYTIRPDTVFKSIIYWMKKRHGWDIQKEWICISPGIVTALNIAVMTFTEPGDKIIVQPPVYPPFFSAIKNHNRQLVTNPLKLINNRYSMDFDDLEAKIEPKVKMIILCNPHNPTGNAWKKEELIHLTEICLKHNIIVLSDEIHSDLVFKGHTHSPTATLSSEVSSDVITCMSPSKTFNLAGLSTSVVIISNEKLRRKFNTLIEKLHLGSGNIFGMVALEASYSRRGSEWLDELINYLQQNIDLLIQFLKQNIPKVKAIKPEATFLVWLDCRELKMNSEQLKKFIINEAKLGLSDGAIFGKEGIGFQRMNLACPKKILLSALERLDRAVKSLKK
jgi:cystathionine beta-lyase